MFNTKKIKFKLKRYINQSRFIESEYDEINLLLDEYLEIFNEDFKYELSLYRSKELERIKKEKEELMKKEEEQKDDIKINIEHIDEENDKENDKDELNNDESEYANKSKNEETIYKLLLKKIYRKLALETHPDKSNSKKSKLFNKVEVYYKEEKILDLLALAVDFEIDIISEIEKIVNHLIQKIKNNNNDDNDNNNDDNDNNKKNDNINNTKDDNIKKINKEYDNLLNDLFIYFEKNIKGKETEVENLKKSVGWAWYHAKTNEKQEEVRKYLYNMWKITEEEVAEYKKKHQNNN